MDRELFCNVIRKLLNIHMAQLRSMEDFLAFERRFRYSETLQPNYTAARFAALVEQAEAEVLYEMRDRLGLCVLFFRLEDTAYAVGPFARAEPDEKRLRDMLIANGVSAAFADSVRQYYSAFPLISATNARAAVLACIQAFSGASEDFAYCRLTEAEAPPRRARPDYRETLDYSTLFQRYGKENRFLRAIELGDTENVLIAFGEMNYTEQEKSRYINAVYQDPMVGLSMIRALARKAAERGGASIIEVNGITQHSVQKMTAARSQEEQVRCTQEMILELTEAVRRHRLSLGRYSAPVQRAVEYLRINFSQEVRLPELAALTALSGPYLSQRFKEEVGMTVSQYLSQLRAMHAAELLRNSDLPVWEISAYVGYLDNNYFVKVFKRWYGVTPTDYRAGKG